MADVKGNSSMSTRVPVREQDPKVRAHNFEEVCFGYNKEEAMLEASRCLHCKNPRCVTACPVSIRIPDFIARSKSTRCPSNSGPSTQANFTSLSTMMRHAPHMPVPSTMMGFMDITV